MPDRLYRYQTVSAVTLANLKSRTLWFGAPVAFNDPFDCALQVSSPKLDKVEVLRLIELYRSQGVTFAAEFETEHLPDGQPTEALVATVVKAAREAFNEQIGFNLHNRGVACFSATNTELLMWAHYADGHRGFCLEFATLEDPFKSAREVYYRQEAPEISPVAMIEGKTGADELVNAMMVTKFESWRYEQEWRVLHKNANVAYTYDWRALTGVYLGAAMPKEHQDVVAQLMVGAPTQLYQMERSEEGFKVTPMAVTYTPFPYA